MAGLEVFRKTLTRWVTAAVVALPVTAVAVIAVGNQNVASASSASFGLAAGISPGDVTQLSNSALAQQMQGIAASGAQWVRLDDYWPQVEGTQGSFNWSLPDRSVQAAQSAGIPNILLVINGSTPSWALNSDGSPNANDYAAFAAASAARYAAQGVNVFELWNEPNIGSNWSTNGTPSVAEYTALLQASYPAIKAADPQSTVLLGGIAAASNTSTTVSPETWLSGIYADGGQNYFDAVSVHPYCWPAAPMDPTTASWNFFYNLPTWIYQVMAANGDGNKKIWITEFGYPTGYYSDAVTPAQQATYLTQAFDQLESWSWAGPMFVYNWQDGTNGSWDTYGLVDSSGNPKPALSAFESAAQSLSSGTAGTSATGSTSNSSASDATSTTSTTSTTTTSTTTTSTTSTTTTSTTVPTTPASGSAGSGGARNGRSLRR
jgi:polysaccharide biosynthesis protein PslG